MKIKVVPALKLFALGGSEELIFSLLTQHLPLQRARRASGHAGLTRRRAYGAWIIVVRPLLPDGGWMLRCARLRQGWMLMRARRSWAPDLFLTARCAPWAMLRCVLRAQSGLKRETYPSFAPPALRLSRLRTCSHEASGAERLRAR